MLFTVLGLLVVGVNTQKYCDKGQYFSKADSCELCPKGYRTPSMLEKLEHKCYPCPMGTYQDLEGGKWCTECPDQTFTYNIGSKSADDCKPISELGKFGSVEVKFSVSISGNLCSMRAALWEVNRITKAKVHSCKEYAEGGKNFTNFVVSTETLPYYAVEAAKHVSYGYWYSYGNKFIAKYAPMLKDMIRSTNPLGLDFDTTMLRLNIEVGFFEMEITPKCTGSYVTDNKQNGLFKNACVKKAAGDAGNGGIVVMFSLFGSDANCEYNSVKSVLSLAFGMDKYRAEDVFGISNATSYFIKCLTTPVGSKVIAAVNGDNVSDNIKFNDDIFNAVLREYANLTVSFEGLRGKTCNFSDGEGFKYEDGDLRCEACPPGFYASMESPMCTPCGYDTYSYEKGCRACGLHLHTFSRSSGDESQCIKGAYAAGDQGSFRRYIEGFEALANLDGDVGIEIHFCEAHIARVNLVNTCKIIAEKIEFDSMLCEAVDGFFHIYQAICKSEDIELDPFLKDAICEFMRPMATLDENLTLDQCKALPKNQTMSNIDIIFPSLRIPPEFVYLAGELVLNPLRNLPGARPQALNRVIETALMRFGIWDLNAFTGSGILNNLRDLVMAVIGNFRFDLFEYNLHVDEKELLCENGNVRYRCPSESCWHEIDGSGIPHDQSRYNCKPDTCNECAPSVFPHHKEFRMRRNVWKRDHGEINLEELECEFPKVSNGHISWGGRFQRVYSCDSGFESKAGHGWVSCEHLSKGTATDLLECEKTEPCSFNATIDNGKRIFENDTTARYQCDDFHYQYNMFARCYDGHAQDYPQCLSFNQYCMFPDSIAHGYRAEIQDNRARYQCNEGAHLDGDPWFDCMDYRNKDELCRSDGGDGDCHFPQNIINGYLADVNGSNARYQCYEGYHAHGSDWFSCHDDRDKDELCQPNDGGDHSCDFPDEIKNGYLKEKYGIEARYECNEGYHAHDSNWFSCHDERDKDELCQNDKKGCDFPKFIHGGEKILDGPKWAFYECYPGFLPVTEVERPGQAACINGTVILPKCYIPEKGCAFPQTIPGGIAVSLSEDGATYECHEDKVLMPTIHGNEALCRADGSMSLPYCISREEAYSLEFKLENSYVLMKLKKADEESEWMTVCDDEFNDYAAGAVCRHLKQGKHGRVINSMMKLKKPPKADIGYTHVSCNYDDTLFYDMKHCRGEEYDTGKHLCLDNEKAAITCYDETWEVEAKISVSKSSKKAKMTCKLNVKKQGIPLNMKTTQLIDGIEGHFYSVDKNYTMNPIPGNVRYKKGTFQMNSRKPVSCAICMVTYNEDVIAKSEISGSDCPAA